MALKSRNDVLWFCLVLLVEVFGLSVALGGPWIEVSYFLLVVVSQTVAGAYIWAHLRKHEQQLPIPEILAMGFAIGSSSAAISQLILRDLLGIRLMISPYAPIIAVAIWLLVKRSTKLGVEITHTDSTTLLWLLFPAPLAMSYFVVELLPVFVVPLTIFALAASSKRFKNRVVDLDNRRFEIVAVLFVLFLTIATAFTSTLLRTFSVAISLIGNDELYDFAHARGFAQWGIQENINVVGETFSYYKLSHLWLGPIVDQLSPDAILITTSILPLFLYLLIGSSLWALTQTLTQNERMANVSTVLVLIQVTLPEPYILERRPLYLFSAIIFIAIVIFNTKTWKRNLTFYFAVFLGTFIAGSTRVQYALVLYTGILIASVYWAFKQRLTFIDLLTRFASISLGLCISYQVFFRTENSQTGALQFQDLDKSIGAAFGSLALRVWIPFFVVIALKLRIANKGLIVGLMIASLLYHLFFPRFAAERYTIEIFILIGVPFASAVLVNFLKMTWKPMVYIAAAVTFLVGIMSRLTYDIFKWRDPKSLPGYQRVAQIVSSDSDWEIVFTILPVTLIAGFAYISIRKIYSQNYRTIAVAVFISTNLLGISLATQIRTITSGFRYGTEIFASSQSDTATRWKISDDHRNSLSFFLENSNRDDIFATSAHSYDIEFENYGSTLIITSITGRRSILEAPFFFMRTKANSNWNRFNQLMLTSLTFPNSPNDSSFNFLRRSNVKWFVVDLERTELRDWEPWATTRYINDKVAILELATDIVG